MPKMLVLENNTNLSLNFYNCTGKVTCMVYKHEYYNIGNLNSHYFY